MGDYVVEISGIPVLLDLPSQFSYDTKCQATQLGNQTGRAHEKYSEKYSISNLAGASSLNILSCNCFLKMRALTFVVQNPITLLLLDPVESNKYSPLSQAVNLLYGLL